MIIRPAVPEDDKKLLQIEELASQEGKIWLASRRTSFFDKLNFFDDGLMLVAEDEKSGEIIGCCGGGFYSYWLKKSVRKGVYLFSLRTNPNYRSKVPRWLKAFSLELDRRLAETDVDFVFGCVKADNTNAIKVMHHIGFKEVRTLNYYSVPVLRKRAAGVTIEARPETEEINRLYLEKSETLDLIPVDMEKSFLNKLIAEGRLFIFKYKTATALVWDTSGEYDLIITRLSRGLGALRTASAWLTRILPVVRVPEINSPLKSWNVLVMDYKDPSHASKTLKAIHEFAWKKGVTLLNFAEDSESNELAKALGPFKFKVPFIIMCRNLKEVQNTIGPVIWPPRL